MANDDFHPADDLAKAFQGFFNGDNIKEALRSAWDRHFGPPSAQQDPDKPAQQMNWTPKPNAEQQQYLDAKAAASIRTKAAAKMGGK